MTYSEREAKSYHIEAILVSEGYGLLTAKDIACRWSCHANRNLDPSEKRAVAAALRRIDRRTR